MRKIVGVGVVGAALVLAGCPKDPPASNDAGVLASASAAPRGLDAGAAKKATGDTTIRAVGQSLEGDAHFAMVGGKVLVVNGSLLWEAKSDGELALLGGPAAWAPLFSDDENLAGYGATYPHISGVTDDGNGNVLLAAGKSFRIAGEKLEVVGEKSFGRGVPFQKKALVERTDPNTGAFEVGWLDGTKEGVPAFGINVRAMTPTKGGGLVAIGTSKKDPSFHAVVVKADGTVEDTRLQTNGRPSCDFVPSFDGAVYVRCGAIAKGKDAQAPKIHRLEGAAFQEVFAEAQLPDPEGAMSIDAEGALYAAPKRGLKLTRCPKTGACAAIEIDPGVAKGVTTALYRRRNTDAMESSTSRYWETLDVDELTPGKEASIPPTIRSLVARAPDDVWVVTSTTQGQVIAHSGAARPFVTLPSDINARVMVRNTKPAARWTGHCEQVFVRIAGARGDKVLDVEAAKKRLPDVKQALTVPRRDEDYFGAPFHWAMVEGTLGDERVVGVFAARADAEASIDRMETAVQKLVDKLATDPVTKPPVTCTLPMLKSKLGGPSAD